MIERAMWNSYRQGDESDYDLPGNGGIFNKLRESE
jgi:hypothetical protein